MIKPSEDQVKEAAKILSDIYGNIDETIRLEMNKNKASVIGDYAPIFSIDRIDSLQYEKLEEFAQFEHNCHWKGIFRHSNQVKENFDKNREALKILVDPKVGPIGERLSKAYQLSKGLGPALMTAILLIEFPESCGVLNGISYSALKDLKLVTFSDSTYGYIKNYSVANEVILRLKDFTKLDLWTLDWMFYDYEKNMGKDPEPEPEYHKWYVEKTNESNHRLPTGPNSDIGKLLFSPKTDSSGREIYRNMELISPGDYVIHLVMDNGNSIMGVSVAKESAKSFAIPPGTSKTSEGFMVELEGFRQLSAPLEWSEIRKNEEKSLLNLLEASSGLFYDKDLDLHQGAYITAAPKELVSIINRVYKSKTNENLPYFESTAQTTSTVNTQSPPDKDTCGDIPKNIILHGPVGTGKTFYAKLLARGLAHNKIRGIGDIEKLLRGDQEKVQSLSVLDIGKEIRTVTFHQSYGYEDFIGGIKATTGEGKGIEYKVVPGIFKTLCDEARKDLNKPYVMIIDEINRGDISRIFGELITLIEDDKRSNEESKGMAINLPNFDEEFSVPENVYIIGTMNDSDRSIALLDVALRRRFLFFLVPPSDEIIKRWLNNNQFTSDQNFQDTVIGLFKMLNQKILETKGEDFLIGHAFFKDIKDSTADPYEALRQTFMYKIIPLLKEMYYGRDEILYETLLNKKFFSKKGNGGNTFYDPIDTSLYSAEGFKSEIKDLVGNTIDRS